LKSKSVDITAGIADVSMNNDKMKKVDEMD